MNPDAVHNVEHMFGPVILLVIIGVVVIWGLSFISEGALQKAKPVMIFMIIAGGIGFFALGAFNA